MAASLGAIDAGFEDGASPLPQVMIGDPDYYDRWQFTAGYTQHNLLLGITLQIEQTLLTAFLPSEHDDNSVLDSRKRLARGATLANNASAVILLDCS